MSGRLAYAPARVLDDKRVSPAALRVLLALGTYANRDGWCHPRQEEIGARLGISRQAVAKQLAELKRLGYVQWERRRRSNGTETSSQYRVLFDADLAIEHDRAAEAGCPQVDPAEQPEVAAQSNLELLTAQPPEVAYSATPRGCTPVLRTSNGEERVKSTDAASGAVGGRPRNPLWDAVAAVWPTATPQERSLVGKAVKALKASGITDEFEVERRGRECKRRFDNTTPLALLNHWSNLAPQEHIPESLRGWG